MPNYKPTIGQAATLINRGLEQRTTAATAKNDISSRSHTVLTITLEQRGGLGLLTSASAADFATMAGQHAGYTARSKLVLVDLAGSERGRKSMIYVQQGMCARCFAGTTLGQPQHLNQENRNIAGVTIDFAALSVQQYRNPDAGPIRMHSHNATRLPLQLVRPSCSRSPWGTYSTSTTNLLVLGENKQNRAYYVSLHFSAFSRHSYVSLPVLLSAVRAWRHQSHGQSDCGRPDISTNRSAPWATS